MCTRANCGVFRGVRGWQDNELPCTQGGVKNCVSEVILKCDAPFLELLGSSHIGVSWQFIIPPTPATSENTAVCPRAHASLSPLQRPCRPRIGAHKQGCSPPDLLIPRTAAVTCEYLNEALHLHVSLKLSFRTNGQLTTPVGCLT
ncbi:hypothetical protein CEXT_617801 [Caerostris extrusa]|uniref:Uncharacterized protein n=1 Tax=Caerostris extrusa TaxID=172846 RepID=A0AAV4PND0_CAEEX|nr:hypothetical protein CEXT_617801 [Caerostris extrusa]